MKMTDKVIVVTGGASGIGAALCRRLAREQPAGIVVADLDVARARTLAVELGALAAHADVSSEADVQELVHRATRHFGRVDVFCSNAGIGHVGDGLNTTTAQWQRIWEVNTLAHVHAAKAVLPQMLERGEGYLLQTASAAGLLTHLESPSYAVTKHAAVAFAEWLSVTYGERGIRVSCLCPQGVRTPMFLGKDGQRRTFLSDGALEPEVVAEEVLRGMAAEQFLILPHPRVLTYLQRKASDIDRWLRGMRKLRAQAQAVGASAAAQHVQ